MSGQYKVRTGYLATKLIEKKARGGERLSYRKEEEDKKLWIGI